MTTEEAFLETKRAVGSLTLRPFTIGSMTACRKLGLTLFTGENTKLSTEETQRQVVAFAWLQSTPVPEVLQAIQRGIAEAEIDAFEWMLEPTDLPFLEREINRLSEGISVASVDVIQRDAPKDPNEPGN
jgi:hypothetical protein